MDIRQFAVEETSVLALTGPDDQPLLMDGTPATVTLYGPGSKVFARAQAAQQNRLMDKLKRKGKSSDSAEDKARETAEFLAECTKEFSPNVQYGEVKKDSMAYAIYAEASIGFIAEQVGKHLGDWANFKAPSPKS